MPLSVELIRGWVLPILLAPFVGSFLGVVVERLPAGRPIAVSRSACDSCGRPLTLLDLVPIASFLALQGRCRTCFAPIPIFHLWIELAAIAVAISAAWAGFNDSAAQISAGCVLGWTLLPLAWIDARTFRLPDALTLPLILGGLAEAAWLDPESLGDRALAAALGYVLFRLVGETYRWLRRREGLGQGDAKLLAAGGAWLGSSALPDIVLAAALAGLMFALSLRLRGTRVDGGLKLPFGPFLAAGIWLAWLIASWPSMRPAS